MKSRNINQRRMTDLFIRLLSGAAALFGIAMLGWMSDTVGEGIGQVSDAEVEAFVDTLETALDNNDKDNKPTAAQPA